MPGYHIRQVASLEALPGLRLDSFRALVLYFHHKTLSAPALAALERFVHQGGGLLALHSASASFKEEPDYFDILGGRFDHHGPVQVYRVEPAVLASELSGASGSFSIRDELYRHKYDPGNTVHFWVETEQGREPLVWTRSYGQGRVCYCAAGHCSATLRHPSIQSIIRRGLGWVCGEQVA